MHIGWFGNHVMRLPGCKRCGKLCMLGISKHKYSVHSGTFGSMSDGRWAMGDEIPRLIYVHTYIAAREVESACVRWKFQDPGTAGMPHG